MRRPTCSVCGSIKKQYAKRGRCLNCEREPNRRAQRAWDATHPEEKKRRAREYYQRNGQKVRAAVNAYSRANKDAHRARSKAYARNNPERVRRTRELWLQAHPEKRKGYSRRYYEENKDKFRADRMIRRARKNSAPGRATREQIAARVAFYGRRCAYCRGPYEHLDHVVPIARGGSNWPANLRPACAKCNLKKGAKRPREWRQRA